MMYSAMRGAQHLPSNSGVDVPLQGGARLVITVLPPKVCVKAEVHSAAEGEHTDSNSTNPFVTPHGRDGTGAHDISPAPTHLNASGRPVRSVLSLSSVSASVETANKTDNDATLRASDVFRRRKLYLVIPEPTARRSDPVADYVVVPPIVVEAQVAAPLPTPPATQEQNAKTMSRDDDENATLSTTLELDDKAEESFSSILVTRTVNTILALSQLDLNHDCADCAHLPTPASTPDAKCTATSTPVKIEDTQPSTEQPEAVDSTSATTSAASQESIATDVPIEAEDAAVSEETPAEAVPGPPPPSPVTPRCPVFASAPRSIIGSARIPRWNSKEKWLTAANVNKVKIQLVSLEKPESASDDEDEVPLRYELHGVRYISPTKTKVKQLLALGNVIIAGYEGVPVSPSRYRTSSPSQSAIKIVFDVGIPHSVFNAFKDAFFRLGSPSEAPHQADQSGLTWIKVQINNKKTDQHVSLGPELGDTPDHYVSLLGMKRNPKPTRKPFGNAKHRHNNFEADIEVWITRRFWDAEFTPILTFESVHVLDWSTKISPAQGALVLPTVPLTIA